MHEMRTHEYCNTIKLDKSTNRPTCIIVLYAQILQSSYIYPLNSRVILYYNFVIQLSLTLHDNVCKSS